MGTTSDAVALLLERCPEFESEWIIVRELMDADTPAEVGIYNVFGQIVLPALQALLTAKPSTDQFEKIIPANHSDRSELVSRLYEVLDRWAAATSQEIRDAVFLEMTEGYGGLNGGEYLSVDALLVHAGPQLKRLVETKRRGWFGPFEDLLAEN